MSKHRHVTTRQPVRPAESGVVPSGARTDAGAVLAGARRARATADAAEAEILCRAVEWARLHPVDDTDADGAAQWLIPGVGREGLMIAGEGAPLVAEWCIAELATVLGLSTDAGMALVGEALELAYRLPWLWARVQAGEVTVWRARRVAAQTIRLTAEAADHVDRQVAAFAHSITGPGIERLVADAVARFMPQTAEEAGARAADRRCFEIDHQQVSFEGTSRVYGELDLADALDLDAAVAAGAEQLKALGSLESLDVRRSLAAGELARRQLTLGFEYDPDPDAGLGLGAAGLTVDADAATGSAESIETGKSRPTDPAGLGHRVHPVREVVIYAHLSAETITHPDSPNTPAASGTGFARVENTGTKLLTPAQIATWCGTDTAKITVRPVIDLNATLSSTSYEIPDRIREQIILRDRTCRFPHCGRTARRADIDHIDPWHAGGATSTENLAALCRRHHRYKTHHGWTYHRTGPATYQWTSPHGFTYTVTPAGTRAGSRPGIQTGSQTGSQTSVDARATRPRAGALARRPRPDTEPHLVTEPRRQRLTLPTTRTEPSARPAAHRHRRTS